MKKNRVVHYVLGAVGLYVVSWGIVTGLLFHYESEAAGLQRRAEALGEKHAPMPTASMLPLKQACAGKLAAGDATAVVGYVSKMEPSKRPTLEKDYWHVDQTLLGTYTVFQRTLSTRHMKDAWTPTFQRAIKQTANPVDWSRLLKRARAGNPEMGGTKYLVVARYESLTLPNVRAEGYDRGSGAFGARVLAFPSGEVLCEGRGEVRMADRVAASGRSKTKGGAEIEAASNVRNLVPFVFTLSVVTTPLHEVCEAGGKALCELTAQNVGYRPQ